MSLSRTTLGILGVWPNPEKKNERFTFFHFIVAVLFVFFTTILTQNIQLFLNWGNLDVMSDILACAHLPIIVALVKMIVLWFYRKSAYIYYKKNIYNSTYSFSNCEFFYKIHI